MGNEPRTGKSRVISKFAFVLAVIIFVISLYSFIFGKIEPHISIDTTDANEPFFEQRIRPDQPSLPSPPEA